MPPNNTKIRVDCTVSVLCACCPYVFRMAGGMRMHAACALVRTLTHRSMLALPHMYARDTTSFNVHHIAAISAAAVAADSRMIRTAAQSLSCSLLAPPPTLAPAPAPALAPVASAPA